MLFIALGIISAISWTSNEGKRFHVGFGIFAKCCLIDLLRHEKALVLILYLLGSCTQITRLCGDGDFDLNTGLDVDDDLLHDLGRGVQVDQTLVDPIPLSQHHGPES
jgi:hypothetical protein